MKLADKFEREKELFGRIQSPKTLDENIIFVILYLIHEKGERTKPKINLKKYLPQQRLTIYTFKKLNIRK